MSFPSSKWAAWATALLAAGMMMPSCKDKKASVASDLEEAGFRMTAEDWFRAAREGNVEAMRKFVSGGFSKDTRDEAGNSALHAAAAAGSEESAEYLLKAGLPIDDKGEGGRTPLMAAVVANQPEMVKWLLRQGADPQVRDDEGYKPLMLAVREGSGGSVVELASYDREDLDAGLLLAALLGRADVIDSLTNYGASVYSRMEDDGRTPLMLAAENGHKEAVVLLLDIGSSRHTTNTEGKTAAMLATEAGHSEIAALINREPVPDELALRAPEEISAQMDAFVAAAEAEVPDVVDPDDSHQAGGGLPDAAEPSGAGGGAGDVAKRRASRPIEGAVLGGATASNTEDPGFPVPEEDAGGDAPAAARGPRIVMRHYRETDVPLEVTGVGGGGATLRLSGAEGREVRVQEGQAIPGSQLVVIRVNRRMEDSKLSGGQPMEVSVVEVNDPRTGVTREWISGRSSTAHDPIALVEDAATGERYTVKPGQRFTTADGGEYIINDVRPTQVVIEDLRDGSVETVVLRGPRG